MKKDEKNFYTSKSFGIMTGVVVVIFAGYFFMNSSDLLGKMTAGLAKAWESTESSTIGVSNREQNNSLLLDAGYENYAFNFRFKYPARFRITEFEEADGYLLLAEGGRNESFQIFILPWDEHEETLTAERVRRDIPTLPINDPNIVELPNGRRALIFESVDEGIHTREAWLIGDGHLFQISAPIEFDITLAAIMGTWEFIES